MPPTVSPSASHASARGSHALSFAPPNTKYFFGLFYCSFVYVILYCLGLSGFVLVPLYSTVSYLDSNSTSTASASFRWLSLFLNRGIVRLVLLCALLVFVTVLCGPLKGPAHLFDPFPTFCNYLSTVLV
jgi:hypothetical protein